VGKASGGPDAQPEFFETDTFSHCGPTAGGELARTLTLIDVHTGWIQLKAFGPVSEKRASRTHRTIGLKSGGQPKTPYTKQAKSSV